MPKDQGRLLINLDPETADVVRALRKVLEKEMGWLSVVQMTRMALLAFAKQKGVKLP